VENTQGGGSGGGDRPRTRGIDGEGGQHLCSLDPEEEREKT
jgi:hypothetical protein